MPFDVSAAATATRRDVIEIEGGDAAEYLDGQLSQNVRGLAVEASAMTLLLQPQGKVEAWMRMTRLAEDRFWLDVEAGFGEPALERLLRFKLRVDAELTLSTYEVTAVRGPGAAQGPSAIGIEIPNGAVVLDALWPGVDGFDVFAPIGPWLGDRVPEVPLGALEALRIRLGIPAMGHELDGSTIPAAAGIVEGSVDFTKGCFVGQELVARIDSRGSNTPTRLCGVRLVDHADLVVGTPIMLGEKEIGSLTSIAPVANGGGAAGLSYIKRAVDVPTTATVIDRSGDSVDVELVELPFI